MILQDAGSGVVTGDKEHLVERHFGYFGFAALFAHGVVCGFFAAVALHAFSDGLAYFVVDGFGQQPHQREDAFACCRQRHDEGLQAGRHHLASVGAAYVAPHAGPQYGEGAQEQHVALRR